MGWVSGIALYFMIWWVLLFAVLPWGIERNDGSVKGADPGAPQRHNLAKKFMINTVLAAIVWLVIYALVRSDYFSFQSMAERLAIT